jgi:hypothetical protein
LLKPAVIIRPRRKASTPAEPASVAPAEASNGIPAENYIERARAHDPKLKAFLEDTYKAFIKDFDDDPEHTGRFSLERVASKMPDSISRQTYYDRLRAFGLVVKRDMPQIKNTARLRLHEHRKQTLRLDSPSLRH